MEHDDELPLDEQLLAEDSAPAAVASLIRTKEDALRIHRVIQGHVELTEAGRTQCRSIHGLLATWDSPEFGEGHAERIDTECDELDVLFREHNEMMELAAVRIPLYAIAIAAQRHAEDVSKARREVPLQAPGAASDSRAFVEAAPGEAIPVAPCSGRR